MSDFKNIKTKILQDNIWLIDLIEKEFEKINQSEEKEKDYFIFSEILNNFQLDYQMYKILNNLNIRNHFLFSEEIDLHIENCKKKIRKLQIN